MARLKAFLRLCIANGVVLAVLLAVLNGFCWVLISGYNTVRYDILEVASDSRAELPVYDDRALARQIYQEHRAIPVRFRSYVDWRREPYQGRHTTVDAGGSRRHFEPSVPLSGKTIGVFGGSTVWGTGVADADTIPAQLQAALPGVVVFNEGESGYMSRNSLDRLINLANQNQMPDVVIFYDGVNDIEHQCEPGSRINAHHFEDQINRGLEWQAQGKGQSLAVMLGRIGDMVFLEHTRDMAQRIVKRSRMMAGKEGVQAIEVHWMCAGDSRRTRQVVSTLIENWRIAHAIVTARGGHFLAVLQPNAYIGRHRTDYLTLDDRQRAEYLAVYAELRRQLAERPMSWVVDFTDSLDVLAENPVFTDFCHLGVAGNRQVAQRLLAQVKPLLGGG
ncbi:SGNH/GDSL hydrolase family protein [Magnetospirillum moscoviense]|uniref:SGNH hydrolase-type esterase domain-containing protein n=1 Tax=Magnetospirillum moscoviense TaxID=1437059 RepID=A0A178MYR0_9PROT|nr:SGNH/GDSL hydrolase family protein [Magnetospirillum moscoviense]OAN54994.1 hypothetical protein A6A05_00085 [Magnetospirillum moscoviense]